MLSFLFILAELEKEYYTYSELTAVIHYKSVWYTQQDHIERYGTHGFFSTVAFKCVSIFFIRIRFLFHFFFFSSSLYDDWLSQCPTAKIYVKCVESLKSLKCLVGIVLNHFRSVSNIYKYKSTTIIATTRPFHYLLFQHLHSPTTRTTFYPSFRTTPFTLYVHTHRVPSPHTMQHCQIRNWLNTSRLHQMTSFSNFLIRYNLDFLHRFTSFSFFVVEVWPKAFLSLISLN